VDYLIIVLLGAAWGSFANVCIYRLPKNDPITTGRSYCPNCKKKIKWFDNIPVLSFIFLMAKCRFCKKPINIQYFIVEKISLISFVVIYFYFGLTITTLLFMVLSIFFIIIFFIDLKHFIILDVLTFPLMIIGFAKSFDPNLNTIFFPNFINSLIGGVSGYLSIWLIIFFYKQIRKKEGMGLGDAKLMAAIGFWFGWVSIPFIIFLSSVLALAMVVPSLIKKTKNMTTAIPFGPYIIAATTIYIIFSDFLKNLLIV